MLRKVTITLLVLYLYTAISAYATVSLLAGLPYTPLFTPLLTLLAFAFCILHGAQRIGWRQVLLLLGLTFGVSLLFESVGVATGWVYGPYHYTDKLGVKFLGLVPLLIPVAWFQMIYPSYVIASRLLTGSRSIWRWRLALAAVGGMVMTAWDLVMDPLMAGSEHWVWEVKGAYFGVPVHNYIGWWLTVFVTFLLFIVLTRMRPASYDAEFDRLAVMLYAIIGLSMVIVGVSTGLEGPALVGVFAMLPWVIMTL